MRPSYGVESRDRPRKPNARFARQSKIQSPIRFSQLPAALLTSLNSRYRIARMNAKITGNSFFETGQKKRFSITAFRR
jgi:hypothetical protein